MAETKLKTQAIDEGGVAESRVSFADGIVRMVDTPWTAVLSLTNQGNIAATDLDLTANTSATAIWVLLKVLVRSTDITDATYIRFYKKGDTGSDHDTMHQVYSPPSNGYNNNIDIWVPMDSEQRITYVVNANPTSFNCSAYVKGYIETT